MTTVTVLRDGLGICGLRVSGHAGFSQSGSDIVCAAVSALTTTCANALEAVASVIPAVSADERQALLSIRLPQGVADERRHDADIVLQTALQGLKDIAAQYPRHVHIIDGRNTSC